MYLYPAGYRLLLRASGKAEMQEPENWLKGGAMIKVIDNKIYRRQDNRAVGAGQSPCARHAEPYL